MLKSLNSVSICMAIFSSVFVSYVIYLHFNKLDFFLINWEVNSAYLTILLAFWFFIQMKKYIYIYMSFHFRDLIIETLRSGTDIIKLA